MKILCAMAAAALLAGCSLFSKLNTDCHRTQEYQHAREAPPLKVPQGLDTPNTQGALVIPAVEYTRPPPGPKDACLDLPPRYQPAPTNKAGSSSG